MDDHVTTCKDFRCRQARCRAACALHTYVEAMLQISKRPRGALTDSQSEKLHAICVAAEIY